MSASAPLSRLACCHPTDVIKARWQQLADKPSLKSANISHAANKLGHNQPSMSRTVIKYHGVADREVSERAVMSANYGDLSESEDR